MKNYRFYLEFPSEQAKRISGKAHIGHSGNVVALEVGEEACWQFFSDEGLSHECIAAVTSLYPNNDVTVTMTSQEFLSDLCKRISEQEARQIHPRLFEWLDA